MSAEQQKLPFGLPAPISGKVDLLIVAGEHSGDEHAAKVVRELLAKNPRLKICALGGPELAAAGAQLLHDLTATSVVGLVEILKHYSFFSALFDATLGWIERHQPRAVCFVDYPGFNLRLAAKLRHRRLSVKGGGRVKLLYYISPQIWAWKPQRRFTMARDLDALAVIFPFEPACYADTPLAVEFVGHPFLASDYAPPVRYDPSGPVLLLPGSRVQAVSRIFPGLLAGFVGFLKATPAAKAIVLYPSAAVAVVARAALAQWPQLAETVELRLVTEGRAASPFADSDNPARSGIRALPFAAAAVLTSSGTMSLHCALAGIPGAVVYRTNPLTYLFARWLVKVEFIGIANLLLKEPMYPEFIQGAATPAALAAQLCECAGDAVRRERTRTQSRRLRELLQQPTEGTANGPAGRSAADWVARHLG
ncbi:MAG: lipid-A-disaccharide synthase [Lacunisphaera sp.]|nr:lipid-A-disaccharide synthase [Lacunisphaera sp.]